MKMSLNWSVFVLRSLVGAVLMLMLGCSGNYPVRTYEGAALSDDQVAIVKVPGDINMVAIDGQPMKSYLIKNIAVDYYLLPGDHTLVLKYSGVWAAPTTKTDEGSSSAELVQSAPLQVKINAEAGKVYSFDYPVPQSRMQAIEIAKSFEVTLHDDKREIARSQAYQPEAAVARSGDGGSAPAAVEPAAVASVTTGAVTAAATTASPVTMPMPALTPAPAPTITSSPTPAAPDLPRLEALKVLWESASKDEKKEFMRWAFK
jgi:uncharacterized protein YccT (UPF0319 family)